MEAVEGLAPLYVADGYKWVRGWLTYPGDISADMQRRIKAWKAKGIKVIMTLTTRERDPDHNGTFIEVNLGGAGDVTKWAERNRAFISQYIDILSVGNEWDLNNYRPSDIGGPTTWPTLYVDRFLKPLRLALPGVKLAMTSLTDKYNVAHYAEQVDKLKAAGAESYCDYWDFHPYVEPRNFTALDEALASLKPKLNKPLISTEALVIVSAKTTAERERLIAPHWPNYIKVLRKYFRIICMYQCHAEAEGQVGPHTLSGQRTSLSKVYKDNR